MPVTWTNDHIVDNLLRAGVSWSGSTITYGFPTSAPGWSVGAEGRGFSTATSAQRTVARIAIGLWDDLMAPHLAETSGAANITLQNSNKNTGYAHAYFPGGGSPSGSVWFNPDYDSTSGTNDLVTPKTGQWGFLTYIHELGHAFGLDHPGNYNGGSPTYAADALYAQDSVMYSVMSYFDGSDTGADWIAGNGRMYFPQTPMLHDVLAMQALYGADMATRAGNTHYGFNSDAGRPVFDFTANAHPILTIWDGGGIDTLDLSGFAAASRIDLNPGAFSDCDGMTMNLAIAFSCFIENATGGAGNDSIAGNVLANALLGNGGNDTLLGRGGKDVMNGGTGNDLLNGGGGGDTLTGGTGADTFSYAALTDAPLAGAGDLISDFVHGTDHVSLARIDAIAGGADDAFHFTANGGAAGFSNSAGEIRFTLTATQTILEGDVNSDGVADFHITFTGLQALGAADFML